MRRPDGITYKHLLDYFKNADKSLSLIMHSFIVFPLSSPWPYANLEKGYDLVTGEQAPERIFR